ncbi:unnamed protein product [Gongylonema pulchrum]|uniref:Uncharacterized protein n=1 Tax=Gongylonema pulchrum TaxID=637853 RepID=A0A183D5N8_9BILA|nr:unnamed protein product [Gongylonema pulchrum]
MFGCLLYPVFSWSSLPLIIPTGTLDCYCLSREDLEKEQLAGIPNEFATKLVITLMGFLLAFVLLCLLLVIVVQAFLSDKEEMQLSEENAAPTKVKIDKAHSPYIVTPEQKLTQQLLAAQHPITTTNTNDEEVILAVALGFIQMLL